MRITRFGRSIMVAMLTSTVLVANPAFAQNSEDAAAANPDDDIVVTAQKREENLQNVPISIQALGTKKLDQLNVTNFNDFSKLLPSVSFQTSQPGSTTVYMRGVASGGDGNHSGSLPSVGVYLDEQPVTTIGGTLDVHIYDIARIESLAGPQGTLYGASSEAGTIRIITNKPSTAGFEGRVDGEVNTVKSGGVGGRLEGMVNVPVSSNAALRVVGWYQHNAGYIDNVAGTRSFLPTVGGITVNNAAFVKKNYNDVDIAGGRAALKIDLNDNWTVTPTILYQDQRNHGSFGTDPKTGDLKVQHFSPEFRHDRFGQAALTIEGKVGNWDVTYAGAYMDRKTNSSSDYIDYAEAYDQLYASSGGIAGYFYFTDAAGNTINSQQTVLGTDHFKKMSHEFRVASPQDEWFRVVAGLFYQNQSNIIHQDYQVKGLGPLASVNGLPGTLWLTQQKRVDKDYAVFGEAAFDILPNLTLTAGGRAFIYDNSLIGFFGFGRNPGNGFSDSPPNAAGSNRTGVAQCFTTAGDRLYDRDTDTYSSSLTLLPAAVAGGPCTNLARYVAGKGLQPVSTEGQGFTHRLNLTWKPSEDLLLYATWSRGFRPGGINRRGTIPPYAPDFLTNYEAGLKATLMDGALRFNAAVFEQKWKSFQFAYLGQNSFTEIHNGPNARIRGIEADLNFKPVDGLAISVAGAYIKSRTQQNLCAYDDPSFTCTLAGPGGLVNYIAAQKGTSLPVTPQLKISGTARYEFEVGANKAHVQATVAHQSGSASDIRTRQFVAPLAPSNDGTVTAEVNNPLYNVNPAALTGRLSGFTTADFSAGYDFSNITFSLFIENAFDARGQLSRYQECGQCYQRPYVVTNTPRTIGLRLGTKF
jgi:iron complex outermembrane recepter protein